MYKKEQLNDLYERIIKTIDITDELFERLKKKNVEIAEVTLNIGLGTFRPVKKDDIRLCLLCSL